MWSHCLWGVAPVNGSACIVAATWEITQLGLASLSHRHPHHLGVFDTLSDSIQYLNLPKNDSFYIWFNIALPKIQFKILLDS